MSKEDNIRAFKDWLAGHVAHDIDRMLRNVTNDITVQSAAGKSMPPAKGKEEARVHWQTIYDTFPDMKMDEIDFTADENKIVAELSHGGTMKGKMGDKEPTGKEYRVAGAFRLDLRSRLPGKVAYLLAAVLLACLRATEYALIVRGQL